MINFLKNNSLPIQIALLLSFLFVLAIPNAAEAQTWERTDCQVGYGYSPSTWCDSKPIEMSSPPACQDNITGGSPNPSGSCTPGDCYTYTDTQAVSCNQWGACTWTAASVGYYCDGPLPSPDVSISGPGQASDGESFQLSWDVSYADSCTASGAWGGSKGTSGGNQTVTMSGSSKTYTLTCTGPGGQSSDSVTVSGVQNCTMDPIGTQTYSVDAAYDSNGSTVSILYNYECTSPNYSGPGPGAACSGSSNAYCLGSPVRNNCSVYSDVTTCSTVTYTEYACSCDDTPPDAPDLPDPTYSCTGSIPSNAQAHDSEESSSLSSDTNWTYSSYDTSRKCQYECRSGYSWNGSSCEAVSYSCTGSIPSNAQAHDSEESSSLSSDTNWTYSSWDTSTKCQFECDPGYNWESGSCVSDPDPNLRAQNTYPTNNSNFEQGDTITFEGVVENTTGESISQGGYAGLEIDEYSDGSYDYYDFPQQGSFSAYQSKNLSRSLSNLPTGDHRYRFNVDSTDVLDETNESDNRSGWRNFSVVSIPSKPDITVTAGACDSGEITVTWNNVSNADEYHIHRFPGGHIDTVSYPATSFTDTGLADNTTYTYEVEAENIAGSNFSSPDSATTPYDCATLNGVDLVADEPAVNEGNNTDPVDGTYNNYRVLMTAENIGMGTLPAGENISYVGTIDYDNYWSRSNDTSSVGYFSGPLAANEETNTLTRTFNDVPFGTHTNCARINLDGSPNFDEYPANYDNNTNCESITVPVPEPPMSIQAADELVRSGETTTISWEVHTTYPLNCTVQGPAGVSDSFDASSNAPNPYTDSQVTNAINNTGQFILTCTEPHTNATFETDTTVEVVPGFEEV